MRRTFEALDEKIVGSCVEIEPTDALSMRE